MSENNKDFKKLFLNDNTIIVSDTETTGLYSKKDEKIIAPELTEFAGLKYKLEKDLKIEEKENALTIYFNDFKTTFIGDYKKINENYYELEENKKIYIINNIPVIEENNIKRLLFKDSLILNQIDKLVKIYNTKEKVEDKASAITKIINKEKLLEYTDKEKYNFILVNFNEIKGNYQGIYSEELMTKWNILIEEGNIEKISSYVGNFIDEFSYIDVSEKDINGNYKYPFLEEKEKKEISEFIKGSILSGHNFAAFDYSNVLKGNGIDEKNYLIDSMFFETKKGKGNSLNVNILYYLEEDLIDLKKFLFGKNFDNLLEKTNQILKFFKKTSKELLSGNILNFDESDLENLNDNFNPYLNNKIMNIKKNIKLLNDRRFAHGAELDVKLNKYVIERKINLYFDNVINSITKEKKKNKLIVNENIESEIKPLGIIGIKTKDSYENITKFDELLDYVKENELNNIVVTDNNPKNYFDLNKKLEKEEIKNTLSYEMNLMIDKKIYPIDIIVPNTKTNLLLSFITEEKNGNILDKENINDLLKFSEAKIIYPLELKKEVLNINNNNLYLGISMYDFPKDNLDNIKNKCIFVAHNKYAKNNKIIQDIIWHNIQENKKINVSELLNYSNDEEVDLKEYSINKLDIKYLNNLYYKYPEIGKNTNNLLEELEKLTFADPVIYDKENIFLTPKKLGLTDKNFHDTNEYKKWTFEYIKSNLSFTKSISPYITALQKYVKLKKDELHQSSKEVHSKLVSEKKEFYLKIFNEYNSKDLVTILDKFEFIKYLIDNTEDFKDYLLNTINEYNNRIFSELDVIFDMPGKGISNGHNLFTTQMVIKTMDKLLHQDEVLQVPENLKLQKKDKYFNDNIDYVINKILNKDNTESIYKIITNEQNKRTVGPGRGSAGGSLLTYCMDITNIDPLRFNLLFERFLNPERISPPDIDADYPFSDNDKGLTIEKFLSTLEKENSFSSDELYELFKDYGLDKKMFDKYVPHYKMIKKLGTEVEATGKSVFRKLLSVLGVPPLSINEYSATYNDDLSLMENIAKKEELYNVYCVIKDLDLDILEGLTMNVGTAASAVMLNFITPTENGKVVPFNKNSDGIFDNKLDILSLATMKLILLMQRQMIKNDDILFNYMIDDLNDKETLLNIQQGKTGVVFQIESSLMTNAVKDLFPLDYQAIADTSAIQRPGPAEWAAAPYLINRRIYYKNYFLKFFPNNIEEEEITNELIEKVYDNIKNKNPYIYVDREDLSKGYMINLEQFKSIIKTKPFLESGEFFKIAGLHTKNILSYETKEGITLKKFNSKLDLINFKNSYMESSNGLTSVEEIYLNSCIEAFDEYEYTPDNKEEIQKFVNKEASKKTIDKLKEFEENLTKNKLYREITDKTYGTLVYQEDIMLLVQKLGGFTIGAADILRRAISKKKYDLSAVKPQIVDNLSNQITLYETEKIKFYKGKENHLMFIDEDGKEYNLGDTYIRKNEEFLDDKYEIIFTTNKIYLSALPKEIVEKLNGIKDIEETYGKLKENGFNSIQNFSKLEATYLYDKMKSFAGYAFNKSHADAYTNITYITAYIKTHSPNIFYNTILRNGNEKNAQNLLREINVYGLDLKIPTVNDINLNNSKDIIFPISKIKNINGDIELAINYLREKIFNNKNITNITELYRNLTKKYLNKTTLVNLSKFGFFNDLFGNMKEKTLTNKINDIDIMEMIIKTLENNEKLMLNYFYDLVSEELEKLGEEKTMKEIKIMVNTYLNNKKEILIYEVEQQRNKYFEFNALEIEKPDEKIFKNIQNFENKFRNICKAYWLVEKNNDIDFLIDNNLFFETFIENCNEKIKKNINLLYDQDDISIDTIKEKNEKIKFEQENFISTLNEMIKNDNEFNEIEKQLLYTDMLKEYNFKKNIVRVKNVDSKILRENYKIFKKDFSSLYREIKNDKGENPNQLKFNEGWIGKETKTLILAPSNLRSSNVSTYYGEEKITPKLIINGQYTVFDNRKIEKDKQFVNNQGKNMTEKRNIQRLYTNLEEYYQNIDFDNLSEEEIEEFKINKKLKYHDFVVQKNGIFYIGSENTETYINDKGFPSLQPLYDGYGNIKNQDLINSLEIKKIEKDERKFNKIIDDLILNNINIEEVAILPSSAVIDNEKIDWVNNSKYLKLLQNLILNIDVKSIIPIGNEALKSIKSLNNINFSGFKTDFNYPYQFGEKLGYSIVTFVENRFIPGFENKSKSFNDYLSTLRKVLKEDIIIDDKGEFENLHKKSKKIDKELSDIS